MDEKDKVEQFKPLSVKEILTAAKPGLAEKIPGFVYRKIEKIIHIKDINELLERLQGLSGQETLDEICAYLNMSMNLHGPGLEVLEQYAKENRPVLFVSNHPFGGPEGILLFAYLHKLYPESKMLVQSYLSTVKPLRECCVFNRSKMRTLIDARDQGVPLLIYPAGYCSRILKNGQVFDYVWKQTFVKIAQKNNMPVFVFHTAGQMSKRTLRWTQFRKFFHIKASIETLYLPDEMLKRRNTLTDIMVSKPIMPECLTKDVIPSEWANRIRQYCFELKSDINLEFNPSEPATLTLT